MVQFVKKFIKEEEGNAFIEYALLAALIGIALIVALGTLKDSIQTVFSRVGSALTG